MYLKDTTYTNSNDQHKKRGISNGMRHEGVQKNLIVGEHN